MRNSLKRLLPLSLFCLSLCCCNQNDSGSSSNSSSSSSYVVSSSQEKDIELNKIWAINNWGKNDYHYRINYQTNGSLDLLQNDSVVLHVKYDDYKVVYVSNNIERGKLYDYGEYYILYLGSNS